MRTNIAHLFILVLCFVLFVNEGYSQTELKSDTIPYELAGEKMILTVKIDGKPVRFIFDSGGRNLVTSDFAKDLNIKIQGNEMVSDVNNKISRMYKGIFPDMEIGRSTKIKNVSVLVTSPNTYFRKLNVAGLLSGEAFSKICLLICSREKQIIMTYPFRPKGISRIDGIKMSMGNNFHTVVPLQIANTAIDFLFDTGMHGLIHLTNNDYKKIKDASGITSKANGCGFWYVGIGGVRDVVQEEFVKLNIDTFHIKDKSFANIGTFTQNRQMSIIGLGLSEYGNIMLDYPRSLFYFFPFDNNITDMNEATKIWNVKILPKDGHFEITGIIGEADFKIGEQVWNINGTDLSSIPLDELTINEIMDSITAETGYLLIGVSKDKTKKVMIKKL